LQIGTEKGVKGGGVLCVACGKAEVEDKQRSEGIVSDSSVLIEQWARCIQMSKVPETASGYWSGCDELEGTEMRGDVKTGRKKIETK
jgi:hypothetical protein